MPTLGPEHPINDTRWKCEEGTGLEDTEWGPKKVFFFHFLRYYCIIVLYVAFIYIILIALLSSYVMTGCLAFTTGNYRLLYISSEQFHRLQ